MHDVWYFHLVRIITNSLTHAAVWEHGTCKWIVPDHNDWRLRTDPQDAHSVRLSEPETNHFIVQQAEVRMREERRVRPFW